MRNKVWLVTGCSTGFGRLIAEQALGAGDRVVATARRPESLAALTAAFPETALITGLDVACEESVRAAVSAALSRFGTVDVLVNNAGYGTLGAFEETPDAELRELFETNVFGLMRVTRAVLPTMRAARSGRILNIGSTAGFVSSAAFGPYNSTKFAVAGFSESLALEVGPLGIKVVLVEPGPFRTDFAGRSLRRFESIADYREPLAHQRAMLARVDGTQPGDPLKAARQILELARMDDPPERLVMGRFGIDRYEGKLARMREELERWKSVSLAMDYD